MIDVVGLMKLAQSMSYTLKFSLSFFSLPDRRDVGDEIGEFADCVSRTEGHLSRQRCPTISGRMRVVRWKVERRRIASTGAPCGK